MTRLADGLLRLLVPNAAALAAPAVTCRRDGEIGCGCYGTVQWLRPCFTCTNGDSYCEGRCSIPEPC
ncbi:hypothetical protein [Pseudonocardia sp. TRM90224]|uniref:hypothetical protein n=1 Tax=Pseudonocardia sp. TRM90224 TaxID=2812678 RepID=UPI001E4BE6C0|nr:hypothetical protein [Pseudonocardia sp. TRM90224]